MVVAALVIGACGDDDGGGPEAGGEDVPDHQTLQLSEAQAEEALLGYLGALAAGDHSSAATMLVGGDEALAERDDLVVLELEELSVDGLADALAVYCPDGCVAATSVTIEELDSNGRYQARAEFGEPRGHPVVRPFAVGATPDGDSYVRGLPPPSLSPIPSAP